MTILDPRAVVQFRPRLQGDFRSSPLLMALQDIPGVRVKRRSVEVPWTASEVVWSLFPAIGLPHSAVDVIVPEGIWIPRPWNGECTDALLSRFRETPSIRPWVYGDAPGPWAVRPFQLAAIWTALERGGLLLEERMGAGKTLQALLWAEVGGGPNAVLSSRPSDPVLVLTKSSVTMQFAREVPRFLEATAVALPAPSAMPVRRGVRIEPDRWLRDAWEDAWSVGHRLYVVVGWDSIRLHVDTLTGFPFGALIIDEVHLGRGAARTTWTHGLTSRTYEWKDNRSTAAFRVAGGIPRRLGMSGTPVFDRRMDLWGQISLIEPHAWGLTSSKFAFRYCEAQAGEHGGLDTSGASNTEELLVRLQHVYHMVPKSVSHAGLPPVRLIPQFVGPEQQDRTGGAFRTERRDLARRAARGEADARSALNELDLCEAGARCHTATLDVVRAVVEGRGEEVGGEGEGDGGDAGILTVSVVSKGKVLVFTERHIDCADLGKKLENGLPGVQVWTALEEEGEDAGETKETGGQPRALSLPSKADRLALRDAYAEHPGPCVLVATGAAWGTGVDRLHDSDALILNTLPWSPGELDQRLGRIERLGMTRRCDVYLMLPVGTVAERIGVALADKSKDVKELTGQEGVEEVRRALLGLDGDREVWAEKLWRKVGEAVEDGAGDGLDEDPAFLALEE